jgi:hypothetical protein
MALDPGTKYADSGMSKAIYDAINEELSLPLEQTVEAAEGDAKTKAQAALDGARDGWKKLAYAIATGVISHITDYMEVYDITTQGDVTTTIQGNIGTAHNVVFTQNNDGAGHVR